MTLLMAAMAAPDSGAWQRLTGYAGAALAAACLVELDWEPNGDFQATYVGLGLFYLTAVLTIATYIYRDITARTAHRRLR
ncbi:hypothetical protein [Yinghuangia seranimata]|uniref:hypothetical protein n=1 Tax=Yinghuangia seranimata TaxID=408067 RepID=UPI00248B4E56|nr:hypothetical protein [Yinghuangia seranimata]MDI2127611.1 hypothetical protein [Yinghuangia seranimata]